MEANTIWLEVSGVAYWEKTAWPKKNEIAANKRGAKAGGRKWIGFINWIIFLMIVFNRNQANVLRNEDIV